MWELPLYADYRKLIDSSVADIKNTGDRYGGAIAAAWFLAEFVGETPWVHLDIAGPGVRDGRSRPGATGGHRGPRPDPGAVPRGSRRREVGRGDTRRPCDRADRPRPCRVRSSRRRRDRRGRHAREDGPPPARSISSSSPTAIADPADPARDRAELARTRMAETEAAAAGDGTRKRADPRHPRRRAREHRRRARGRDPPHPRGSCRDGPVV